MILRRLMTPRLLAGLVWSLSALASGCEQPVAPPRAPPLPEVSFPLRDMRFPSGLRVIIEEDHRAPLVAVATLVGAGSTSDPPGKEGLAHYVEHLAFRARPSGTTSIGGLLARAGAGAHNAGTGLDATLYWEVGPKEALPAFVMLEAARLLGPVANIPRATAAVELGVVRNELRERNETGFVGSTLEHLRKALFPPQHPYARTTLGTHASLSSLTLEDARLFAEEHYRPANVTMVIVGDVDLATVGLVIEEALPVELRAGAAVAAPRARLPASAPRPPDPPEPVMVRHEASVVTPELWIGWTLPRAFDAEAHLGRFAVASARAATQEARSYDPDIVSITPRLVPGAEASLLLFRVVLQEGVNPERSRDRVLDQIVARWTDNSGVDPGTSAMTTTSREPRRPPAVARISSGFLEQQRFAATGMLLDVDSIVARAQERAEVTHFSGDPSMFSRSLRALASIDPERVADFVKANLTRGRARAVLFTPSSGGAPIVEGATPPAPLDDAVDPLDEVAIARFIRGPAVRSYRQVVLDNGLEVIVGRRAGLPIATVGLTLRGGSAAASPRGAAELSSWLSRPRTLSRLHGFGVHTQQSLGLDDSTVLLRGSAGHVAAMLTMMAIRVTSARVAPESVSRFRREVIPQVRRADLSPDARARRAFYQALFGQHPHGAPLLAADLEQVGHAEANAFAAKVAVPRNAILVIVGEVDPEAVIEQARAAFAGWSSGDGAVAPPPPPMLPEARAARPALVVVHRDGATQARIRFGCSLPPAGGSGARRAVLAALVRARLETRVRAQLGASYGVHVRVQTLRGGAAHLLVESDVDNAHLGQALSELRGALQAGRDGELAREQLPSARWSAARRYGARYLTHDSIVEAILRARIEDRDLASIDALPGDLGAVTAEVVTADFGVCSMAPVLAILGDEPATRAAFAGVWP